MLEPGIKNNVREQASNSRCYHFDAEQLISPVMVEADEINKHFCNVMETSLFVTLFCTRSADLRGICCQNVCLSVCLSHS